MSRPRVRLAALALLVVGCLQMAADLAGLRVLKGVAAATLLSPAPKVFSTVRGHEAFSTRFFLEWTDREGEEHSLELTPELTARLAGPYNRRNVYGAALAFGPVLAADASTYPVLAAVLVYGLTGEAPLLRELGLDPADVVLPVRLRYEPRAGTMTGLPRVLEVPFR